MGDLQLRRRVPKELDALKGRVHFHRHRLAVFGFTQSLVHLALVVRDQVHLPFVPRVVVLLRAVEGVRIAEIF